jgi:hypothetical protein
MVKSQLIEEVLLGGLMSMGIQGFELIPNEITLSPIYSMSIDDHVKRCDVFHNGKRVAWMAYFKEEDRIAYFNDVASVMRNSKERAIEMFRQELIDEVLLEDL